ncbi:MAG TPA: peptide chain release factor N(5)-glutamine methyltransferase [Dehalococcoidia bacterium]|nr:peptide chain release factor N(5)-glutamine methyltransferase [Dehalococcoidia bacterium]
MTVLEALRLGKRLLSQVSEEADLDAELLLRHALILDRTRLYNRLNEELSTEQEQRFRDLVTRRITHEPTSYILGHKEFFGLDFEVTPAALIPRPETETLVEHAIAFARTRPPGPVTIADIGTGCGAIAVSLARALPHAQIVAVDISPEAVTLAKRNAGRHAVSNRIQFREGDLLQPIDNPVDVIVANLPYVPTNAWAALPPEIRDHEPRVALDGGRTGLDAIRRLLRQAPAHLAPNGSLFLEIGADQGAKTSAMAREAFPGTPIDIRRDLAGRDRALVVRLSD